MIEKTVAFQEKFTIRIQWIPVRIYYPKSRHMFNPNLVPAAIIYFTSKYRLDPIETESDEI